MLEVDVLIGAFKVCLLAMAAILYIPAVALPYIIADRNDNWAYLLLIAPFVGVVTFFVCLGSMFILKG